MEMSGQACETDITPNDDISMQRSSRVNGVFRIHDLPPETFIRILMHLRDINPPIQALSTTTRAYETKLGWINATHTSLYWRNTLLSNPSFWTRMPFSLGKTWVDAFVHRCQSLPFDIRLETGLRLFGPWVYEFCATYFHRVRDFEVGYSYDMPIDDDPIYTLLERPSTTLQALSVDRMWRRLEYPRMRSSQYPRLRSLHIDLSTMDAGDIPWRDIGPSELADLSVTAQRPSHIDRILSDVVYCLQRLQALVTLKLNLTGQRDNHHNARAAEVHNNGPIPSVTLPNLEKVMLYAVAGELTPMLNHINFPASTLLTLVSYGCIEREPFLATLQPLISVHSKLAPFRHILFSDNHEGNLQLSADASTDRSRNTGQPDTYLRLALSPTVDFFPDILPAIGPDQIYHIDIRCTLECSLASDVILPCFATQLRNVTCISVALSIRAIANPRDGFTPAGILAATLRRLLLPTANSPFCPFPRLAALDLAGISHELQTNRCMHPDGMRPDDFTTPPTFARVLAEIIAARRETGAHMPYVYLQEWTRAILGSEETMLRASPEVVFLKGRKHVVVDENSGEVTLAEA